MRTGPLQDRRILLTRERADNSSLRKLLAAKGAVVIEIPAIRTSRIIPENENEILSGWGRFRWIVFTSRRGVKFFFSWAAKKNIALAGKKIGCVGRSTAKIMEKCGINDCFVPDIEDGKHLALKIMKAGVPGPACYVTPAAGVKSGQELLESKGWEVAELNLYETVPRRITAKELALMETGLDLAFFASPSALKSFFKNENAIPLLKKTTILPIGRTTEEASKKLGLETLGPPAGSSPEEIFERIEGFFREV